MSIVNVQLQGQKELSAELAKIAGPELRTVCKRIASSAMKPVLADAKAWAPSVTGRLAASIGKLATQNKAKTSFGVRVGTRLNFTYTNTAGSKRISGSKKFQSKHAGRTADTVAAQQYARGIEFGKDSHGRIRRSAGPAHFLEDAIRDNQAGIVSTVSAGLRSYLQSRKA